MAVAPEHSPTLLSGDDNTPPTPSDVSSEYDGLTAAEVLSKLEKVWSVNMCSVVVCITTQYCNVHVKYSDLLA